MRGKYTIVVTLALGILALDQYVKWWIVRNVSLYETIPVIDNFMNIVHVRNRGAAFGFLNRSDIEWQFWLFLLAAVIALGAIIALLRSQHVNLMLACGLGCIAGGAAGNLIDRVRYREVVDFLDFYIGLWHWPAFNIADIALCIGAFLTALSFLLYPHSPKEERS